MTRAAVLGAGSWGTTFAKVLADAGCDVTLHARRPELAKAITEDGENPDYLPGIRLPAAAARDRGRGGGARWTPRSSSSPSRRSRCGTTSPSGRRCCPADATLLSLMKGIELGTTKRMSEVICEVTGAGADRVAVLSGPNLAREIAEEQPAATVIACTDAERAERAAGGLPHAATSGRTPTPTWSAASSAGRSRTSSRWPAASPRGSASATTPAPR